MKLKWKGKNSRADEVPPFRLSGLRPTERPTRSAPCAKEERGTV